MTGWRQLTMQPTTTTRTIFLRTAARPIRSRLALLLVTSTLLACHASSQESYGHTETDTSERELAFKHESSLSNRLEDAYSQYGRLPESQRSSRRLEILGVFESIADDSVNFPRIYYQAKASVAAVHRVDSNDPQEAFDVLMRTKANAAFVFSNDASDLPFLRLNRSLASYAGEIGRSDIVETATLETLRYPYKKLDSLALRKKWEKDFYLQAAYSHLASISQDVEKLHRFNLSDRPVAGYRGAIALQKKLIDSHPQSSASFGKELGKTLQGIEGIDPGKNLTPQKPQVPKDNTTASASILPSKSHPTQWLSWWHGIAVIGLLGGTYGYWQYVHRNNRSL